MESSVDDAGLAKRFLLGDASERERAEVEDRLLADDDFYQELLITEEELIDAYACGQMPATERALFEQRYLNSRQRRARVEFAKTLYESVSSKAGTSAPARELGRSGSWWRSLLGLPGGRRRRALGFATAAAVALLFVVTAGIWLLRERSRTGPAPQQEAGTIQPSGAPPRESPSPQIAAAEEQQPPPPTRQKENSQTPAREPAKRTTPMIATFTLLPGAVRGESGTQLVLPAGATEVRLKLGMEGEAYQKYRAELSTPEGTRLWSRVVVVNKPTTNSARLTLSLPANILRDGDYVLAVSAMNAKGLWESITDYSFRVVRK